MPMSIEHLYENYEPTGNITPGGGKSYVHKSIDSCATVYRNYIKVYTERRTDINNDEKIPALYQNEYLINVHKEF